MVAVGNNNSPFYEKVYSMKLFYFYFCILCLIKAWKYQFHVFQYLVHKPCRLGFFMVAMFDRLVIRDGLVSGGSDNPPFSEKVYSIPLFLFLFIFNVIKAWKYHDAKLSPLDKFTILGTFRRTGFFIDIRYSAFLMHGHAG